MSTPKHSKRLGILFTNNARPPRRSRLASRSPISILACESPRSLSLSLSPSLSPCLPAPAPSPPRPGHSSETIYKTLHQPQRQTRLIKTITEQRHHTSTDAQAIYFHAITSHPAWVLCMRERVTTAACERECMRETDRVREREERREKQREAERPAEREAEREADRIAR